MELVKHREQPARWEAARSMWGPEANGMEGTGSGVIRVRCCGQVLRQGQKTPAGLSGTESDSGGSQLVGSAEGGSQSSMG